jgi:signal transduction histidine kinase
VDVRARRDGDCVAIEVSDEGPGVPAEMRDRIFDRFVRGDSDRAGGGSGLGLAIVRAVAARHGGDVGVVESDAGGAEFVVRIPLAEEVPVTPLRPPAAPSAGV